MTRHLQAETRIGELRVAQGLSQPELAKLMGWTGKQGHLRVSAVETGREWLGDDGLERMAEILRVSRARLRRLLYLTWKDGYLNRKNEERRAKAIGEGRRSV